MEKTLWKNIESVKQKSPLIHNITNYVVMNNTANALLAAGASPIMAHANSEIVDMVKLCSALMVNIGTIDEPWFESMFQAVVTANKTGKPWVLDPVGAGATAFRDTSLSQLIERKPAVIRGNASEILALAQRNSSKTKGVDSTADSLDAVEAATFLNQKYNSIVCISGETDIIIGKEKTIKISNGNILMTKVTGLGCTASALTAAFVAANGVTEEAVAAAMAYLGICGEMAALHSKGPGSLQMNILDNLYTLTETDFYKHLKIS